MRLESHGDGIHRYEEHVCRGHYLMQKRWSRLTPVPTLGVGNRSSPLFKDGTIRHGELQQLASSQSSRKQQCGAQARQVALRRSFPSPIGCCTSLSPATSKAAALNLWIEE